VAAIIQDGDRFLVTRRQAGVHLEGLWEFPGGKIDASETHEAALRREIREELDSDIEIGELVLATTHAYSDNSVTLYFYRGTLAGPPRPLLGQEMRWVSRTDLMALEFPPADRELLRILTQTEAR